MKNNDILRSVFLIFCLLASLQSFAAEWSIGIYAGISPLELAPIPSTPNPVLTAHDILDTQANFVADPFLLPVDDTWYLFFEVLNTATNQGDIGYATSDNGLDWTYQQIVLDEPYHLSYPYVFEWQGDYYMVPESYQVNSILLYRAVNFPTDWEFVATLLTGRAYVDPSPFYYNSSWWMYAGGGLDTLYLFFADHLAGPWFEHPQSPVVTGDANIARPGGRVVQFDNRLLRITQDDAPTYGNQVRAFEVTVLSRTYYAEFEVPESPLLSATGYGWNGDGIHHLDPLLLPSGTWFAVADGFGDPQQRQSIAKDNWTLLYVDSEEVIGEDGAAINAFDDDMDTFWHTEWLSAAPPIPTRFSSAWEALTTLTVLAMCLARTAVLMAASRIMSFSPAATVLTGGHRSPPAPLPMTPASRRSNLRRCPVSLFACVHCPRSMAIPGHRWRNCTYLRRRTTRRPHQLRNWLTSVVLCKTWVAPVFVPWC